MKNGANMADSEQLPTFGWCALWSKDRKTLVQIFTDANTGLIQRVTVTQRPSVGSWWGPTITVEEDWQNAHLV